MRSIRLIAASDEYDSTLGFVLKGCKSFDGLMADRDGLLTAHDICEHQNGIKNMGPVWDELEALGGIWYCRGQWGDLLTDAGRAYSPAQNIASDVTRMFFEWLNSDQQALGPNGLRAGSRPSLWDDDFAEVIQYARNDIPGELEPEDYTSEQLETYLTLALHRMRAGFRKAARRYERKGASRFAGNEQMRAIRDAVARAVKCIEFEGQEFILSYGNGAAQCRETWEGFE